MNLAASSPLLLWSSAQDLEDTPEDVIFPPGDLYSDEPPLETYFTTYLGVSFFD